MPEIILIIFYVSTLINIFYWVYFFHLKSGQKITEHRQEPLSIVICGHNEGENIEKNLGAILNQEKVDYEVIFVNDRSTDKTAELLKNIISSKLSIITITHTPDGWNSKKWALMQGVKNSQYDNLLFTDADCYPKSNAWAYHMSGSFANNDIVLGYSPMRRKTGFLNAFIRFETMMTAFSYLGFAQHGMPYMAVGRNFGAKKRLWFDFSFKNVEHVSGGDDDLFINQLPSGTKTAVLSKTESHILTDAKNSAKGYFSQKKRHLNVSMYYSLRSKTFLGIYNISCFLFYTLGFILTYTCLEKNHVFGAIFLRTIILFVIFGVNSRKLGDLSLFLWTFILDFLYSLFLWTWGPVALLAKKVKWK